MYAFTTPFNYQALSYAEMDARGWTSCSRSNLHLAGWLLFHGGQDLGCYGRRAIRGGTSPSTHAAGGANDWRYENVGSGRIEVGRARALEMLQYLIDNASLIGLQQVHDYFGCRIWKIGRGWKTQTKSGNMGATWAKYFHFEFHPDALTDDRSIAERAAGGPVPASEPVPAPNPVVTPPPPPAPAPAPLPAPQGVRMVTVTATVPVLSLGSTGVDVKRLQALLVHFAGQGQVTIDGNFGAQTEQAVKNVQAFFRITVDGWVGAQTWTILIDA